MNMTLDEATRRLADDPAAAGRLLEQARAHSARALQELRDLVHGIGPPVLADRGLADAARSLALDCVLDVHVAADLPGVSRRLGTVDGTLDLHSPPGGPTIVIAAVHRGVSPT